MPDEHRYWMAQAIGLARDMQGWVWPNPAVGCVIVRNGVCVGRGQTQIGGRPHAERVALDAAGARARGSTLYVTLEPCCHYGKTPPCADAIIEAGVTHVHASLQDPDPRVNGGGFRKLREAGVTVTVGPGAAEAQVIMAGFFHRIATGRPLVSTGSAFDADESIPDGFDAMLISKAGHIKLMLRASGHHPAAETLPHPYNADDLLDQLGRRGLTIVFVPGGDPLLPLLEPAIEAQRHPSLPASAYIMRP